MNISSFRSFVGIKFWQKFCINFPVFRPFFIQFRIFLIQKSLHGFQKVAGTSQRRNYKSFEFGLVGDVVHRLLNPVAARAGFLAFNRMAFNLSNFAWTRFFDQTHDFACLANFRAFRVPDAFLDTLLSSLPRNTFNTAHYGCNL